MTACVLTLAFAGHALAVGPASPDEGAIELDLAIQALKDEVIELNRDAQLAEETHLYPPETRLSVYVSTRLPNLLLQEVSLSVDNGAPIVYRYDDRDARALLATDALQRLARLNVERGNHGIKVVFAGQFVEEKKEPVAVAGEFVGTFEKGIEPAEVEVQIVAGARRNEPDVRLRQWKAVE
ncbi:hypothetical protein [Panacagrimonas sp.]|uniref:hypothetical protein n=1 Tax=Panacagrimonas sp. TaxID=2480088 RepID=UPI003B52F623